MWPAPARAHKISLMFMFHPDRRAPRDLAVLLLHPNIIIYFARCDFRVGIGKVHLRTIAGFRVNSTIILDQRDTRYRPSTPNKSLDRRNTTCSKTLTHEMLAHAEIDNDVVGGCERAPRSNRP